jgi:hypothetical protein
MRRNTILLIISMLNSEKTFCFQLVSAEILEKHQAKSLKEAQTNSKNSFICKSPDCQGWWELSL